MRKHTSFRLTLSCLGILLGSFHCFLPDVSAQGNSIVLVHADKSSGYGVAWGGPKNSPDLIVTALHLVAGKKTINVTWQGKKSTAVIEKIYKPSDLALLRLTTPLGIPPLSIYSGDPPWDTNINFWEIPVSSTIPSKKTTVLEGRSSLANISPLMENAPKEFSNSLCMDAGQPYPGMTTAVINFKEPNIRKAHSGSPLTYGDKILGMVDGGARLFGGKPCVWAIPAADFNKLYSHGTPPPENLALCDAVGSENKYMYSGVRSDNPELSPEEVAQVQQTESYLNFATKNGRLLELHLNYTMTFQEVYNTLFEDEKLYLQGIFQPGGNITLDDLLTMPVNLYAEEKTGVSLMIPAQCTLSDTLDDYGTLNTTTSPGGLISMSFYIAPGVEMEEGMRALNSFKEFLKENGKSIQASEDDIKDLTGFDKYYNEYVGKSGSKSVFFANLIINDGDFLAATLSAPDWQTVAKNKDEKLFFYLMQTCAILSDFTVY